MDKNKKINNIIEALGRHQDEDAIRALEKVGTNSDNDAIREKTAQVLIQKNTHNSLKVALALPGKGIHDLSTKVAMSSINEILALKDKDEAIQILEDTMNNNDDENVRDTARSVRALVEFSK